MKLKKILMVAICTIILLTLLTCCRTTKNNDGYQFPPLDEAERIDDGENITVKNKDGEIVFYYDDEKKTVTVPAWYWVKIINFAINTGGLTTE